MSIHLTEKDVTLLLGMPDCISALEDAFRRQAAGRVENLPRRRLHPPAGMMHCMEAADLGIGRMGLKVYTSFAPKARFLVLLFDCTNGDLLATIEADKLGQVRTGAATGVATKYMAREDASILGIFGTGWQAETQAEAVAAVRKLARILVYSRDPQHRSRFAEAMSNRLNIEVAPANTPDELVIQSNILVTATSARSPVFDGSKIKPGTHVNAVGSNSLAKSEVDVATVAQANRVVVDSIEQARIESGDLLIAIETRKLRWEQVRELREVVSGQFPGRESDEEITLFKSNGLALEDIAAASLVYDRARDKGVGTDIGIWDS